MYSFYTTDDGTELGRLTRAEWTARSTLATIFSNLLTAPGSRTLRYRRRSRVGAALTSWPKATATSCTTFSKMPQSKLKATGDIKLIGDFYASCMDEAAIEKAGAHPLDADVCTASITSRSTDDLQARDRTSCTRTAFRRAVRLRRRARRTRTATWSSSTPDRAD